MGSELTHVDFSHGAPTVEACVAEMHRVLDSHIAKAARIDWITVPVIERMNDHTFSIRACFNYLPAGFV